MKSIILSTVVTLAALSPLSVEAGERLVPEFYQLDAYQISYALDLRYAEVKLETDELQYGVLLHNGELSVGDRDTGWKTSLDLLDNQIKLEWNF
ncbi:MAG TPA: hypothetical protein HPP65_07795 [Gammaproteobacteria bacterium]|jgi:hypothetical protein|nr:hypothetical protein [Gammaproteobacteria bacterium]MBT3718519.1 hypothetical protein [Gammaproteobacteria bacterium]MBT5687634.1 hypothetical protein [Gammaproteobacteria bacterium]MBT6478741.1 hypothetical protein [Gammaproteobacteria bacterium]MBT6651251.1 hypothetical protein [Gammaproteobacteria bacterium]